MKPYYQDDFATIYHGDCREYLRGLVADVLITDPVWPNCPEKLLQGWDRPHALFREAMDLVFCRRLVVVLRNDSDPRFLSSVPVRFEFFRAQILVYALPGYIGRKLGGDEIAYCFGDPIPSSPGRHLIPGWSPKVQPTGSPANGHPCSRSLGHFHWLMGWWTLPGEIVVDPFMGSGTTLRAAKDAGRKAIGIEIEERYCEIAAKRLAQEVLPLEPA